MHLLLDADAGVHRLEDGIVGVIVDVPDLQHILDLIGAEQRGILVLSGGRRPELGGVEVDSDLAVLVGCIGDIGLVRAAAVHTAAVLTDTRGLAVIAVLEHAAPEGDLCIGQGGAVGLQQRQVHLGRLAQGGGVQWVELEHGGILLAGLEVLLIDSAHVLVVLPHVARAEPHVAGNSVGLIEGQHALFVGGGRLLLSLAVHIAQGGLLGGGYLEEVELVAQGGDGYRHRVGHAGLGVGGGDGGCAVHGGGEGHGGARQVGLVGKEVDVLVETALLVVHRHHVAVGGLPLDAVQVGVPVVLPVVDAHVLHEAQLLPQLHDGSGAGGQIAAGAVHQGGVVQADGADVFPLAVQDLQGVAVVDVQGEGVGAGGVAAHVGHGEHHLIGVL